MESNLPQKYNEGIFTKIRNFFFKLFEGTGKHSEIETENVQTISSPEIKKEKQKNTIDIMREENKKNRKKEDILSQIEGNLSIIDDLPVEKLLKLEKIYDEKIAEYSEKLERLKNQNV